MKWLFCLALIFTTEKSSVLYKSLDPSSVAEHLAFYQLYPGTPEGDQALSDAWKLLSGGTSTPVTLNQLPQTAIDAIVTLITKPEGKATITISANDIAAIEKLGDRLPNRKLKGRKATTEAEVLAMPKEEVDLSRGLLLAQSEEDASLAEKIDSYDALIDLMALQILTKVQLTDPPEKKIRAINRFIFEEMGYRFPPHSIYAKDIDVYTYLPSVIDSRQGVCLGVSILYLALSQRLNLPLEAITPPGHIYVRYAGEDKTINIETTARGIHLDSSEYLGIETEELQVRSIKDVIGLAYYNEASVHWQNENYERALKCYQKAAKYLPDDLLLQELMGFNYLFVGDEAKGRALIEKVYHSKDRNDSVFQETVMEDYLNGKVDGEGIRTLYVHVDEKRASLLAKKDALIKTLAKWPDFRAAYFHLGVNWLQLNRHGEALKTLEVYESIEKNDPTAEYLLAELYAIRSNYPAAWEHLHRAEELLKNRSDLPKTLKDMHRELACRCPE